MFGRRDQSGPSKQAPPPAPAGGAAIATRPQKVDPAAPAPAPSASGGPPKPAPKATPGFEQLSAAQGAGPTEIVREQSDYYHATKTTIFNALLNTIDLAQLAQLDAKSAAEEIRDIVAELVAIKNVTMSVSEQDTLVQDIINDVLGYGPLEPLLARDDIADIMVNEPQRVFIEVGVGKVQLTNVRFRDNGQLMNICQRIVSQVGRRVDESSPICDARLPDGSRVNVIASPLALDGPTLTIRKFKKDKLTMKNLVEYNSISPEGARARRHRRLPLQRCHFRRHWLGQDRPCSTRLPPSSQRRRRSGGVPRRGQRRCSSRSGRSSKRCGGGTSSPTARRFPPGPFPMSRWSAPALTLTAVNPSWRRSGRRPASPVHRRHDWACPKA